jgi:hypothetical protein
MAGVPGARAAGGFFDVEQSHDRRSLRVPIHCLRRVRNCEDRPLIGLTWIKKIKNGGAVRSVGIDRRATFA